MKNNKKLIISICLSIFTLCISLLGFLPLLKQSNNDDKYINWMSKLDDNTSIRDISIPGSHDTMALYSIADLAGQCQSLDLINQLELGVRFLDIRLKEENNKLKAVHGFIDQKATFSYITNTIEKFLNNHPSEFIFMSIKEEAAATNSNISFEEALLNYLNNDIYLKDTRTVPDKLSSIRGKVILLSRYSNSSIGIASYDNWKDSSSFTMEDSDIYVQDKYQIEDKLTKQEEIIKCFNETGHKLKINFLSAYRTNYFPPSYAVSSAIDINPWINKEISKHSDRGIVLYDFISKSNMDAFFKGIIS